MTQLILSILPIATSILILIDAKKRLSINKSIIISIVTTFFFPIGPILYIIFRKRFAPKTKQTVICPKCGTLSSLNNKQCKKCNNVLTI